MDDYSDGINKAMKELEELRKSQANQEIPAPFETHVQFTISDEISDFVKQRRDERKRMRHISNGVYA